MTLDELNDDDDIDQLISQAEESAIDFAYASSSSDDNQIGEINNMISEL